GGVVPIPEDYAALVGKLCRENDVPLIVDEVQTGNGRTGSLYSYTQFGLEPDVVSTAKGLAGGLPIGATLLGDKMKDVFSPGDNGSTFGGNPVSCAGALYVLSQINDALLSDVKLKSDYVFSEQTGAPGVVSVTGLGLMIGIETEKPVAQVVSRCIEEGVLCLTAKTKLRLLPALNIPFGLLRKAIGIIKSACL
ncbi:MAG: aminotransferase class III-fold pyridoxal phosphate-dependent enzyme, partial [Clostridia bacterium]|nr:aminotransferase class III-fold pyridoxal phosphate-dependent enzyme [Clostridia bacterium]